MSNRISSYFTQADFESIRAAVASAERETSGEIVPFIVEQSDDYEAAAWRAGMLVGFGVLAVIALFRTSTDLWLPAGIASAALGALLAGLGAMMLTWLIHPIRRWFAGREMIDRSVAQRASEAFLSEEVFRTRDRTGILIFVTLLERRIVIMGDSGINARVKVGEWDRIRDHAVGLFIQGRVAEGLAEAVRMSADLLVEHGFARKPDDRNELSDRVRREER